MQPPYFSHPHQCCSAHSGLFHFVSKLGSRLNFGLIEAQGMIFADAKQYVYLLLDLKIFKGWEIFGL